MGVGEQGRGIDADRELSPVAIDDGAAAPPDLDSPLVLAAGLVLVGSCPGGTASNVICYLARGDLALSITLTAVSTLLAVLATPFLTWLYVGQTVPVPVLSMLVTECRTG